VRRAHRVAIVAIATVCTVLAATASVGATSAKGNPYPNDAKLSIADVQMLGTHNSYHLRPAGSKPGAQDDYTHPSLDVQLSQQGVRSLEIDAFNGPTFPVLHSIIVDQDSNCATISVCLQTIATWSKANPGHVPLVLFIETKALPTNANATIQGVIDGYVRDNQLANWDVTAFDRLDKAVRKAFGKTLITPDEVRGHRATLRTAVMRDGWPTLAHTRGGVLVVLNAVGDMHNMYLEGHPSLRGRPMFLPSTPDEPSAAIIKRDVPQPNHFPALERAGFLVKTQADSDTKEAYANDLTRATVALQSGAHVVATDYPVADPKVGPYVVDLPGTAVVRCNPVTAPTWCKDTDLENARGLKQPQKGS
jgi:Phosphoinositide phospholipase C, Ca2+-dependent